MEETPTLANNLVHDGLKLHSRDLHVLKKKHTLKPGLHCVITCRPQNNYRRTFPASFAKRPLNPASTSSSDTVS